MDDAAKGLWLKLPHPTTNAAGFHVCCGGRRRCRCDCWLYQRRLDAKYDLVVLADPKVAIPPYDAVVLLAPKRADDQVLRAALQPLLGKIDITQMREANLRAGDNDKNSSPDTVAHWLWDAIGKK